MILIQDTSQHAGCLPWRGILQASVDGRRRGKGRRNCLRLSLAPQEEPSSFSNSSCSRFLRALAPLPFLSSPGS